MTQEHGQRQSPDQEQETAAAGEKSDGRSAAEWTTLGISVVVLLTIVGLVTYVYASGGDQPPSIAVEARIGEVRQDETGYYLPVDVINEGNETAASVEVEAELDTGTGRPDMASFTVEFLAGGETVRGTFVFEDDPRRGQLTVGAASYNQP